MSIVLLPLALATVCAQLRWYGTFSPPYIQSLARFRNFRPGWRHLSLVETEALMLLRTLATVSRPARQTDTETTLSALMRAWTSIFAVLTWVKLPYSLKLRLFAPLYFCLFSWNQVGACPHEGRKISTSIIYKQHTEIHDSWDIHETTTSSFIRCVIAS